MLNIPLKLDLNSSAYGKIKYQNKEIIFVANRILVKPKIKSAFLNIKVFAKLNGDSENNLFIKTNKVAVNSGYTINGSSRSSPVHTSYSSNSNKNKKYFNTALLNTKVQTLKKEAFNKLREAYLVAKKHDYLRNLEPKKEKLLEYFISTVEKRVKTICFKRMMKVLKTNSAKQDLARTLDRVSLLITKRCFYSQFFLKLKSGDIKNAKIITIFGVKLRIIWLRNSRICRQTGLKKIKNYVKFQKLQGKIRQKKGKISKIYQLSSDKTTILQQQRQNLRALKYKLDHQSIQKSHILTDKRRQQVVAKNRYNQQSKQSASQIVNLQLEITKLKDIRMKQKHIQSCLNSIRKLSSSSNKIYRNISTKEESYYQSLVKKLYSSYVNLLNDDENKRITNDEITQLIELVESRLLSGIEQDFEACNRLTLFNVGEIDEISKVQMENQRIRFYEALIEQHEWRKRHKQDQTISSPLRSLKRVNTPVHMLRLDSNQKSASLNKSRVGINPNATDSPPKRKKQQLQTIQMMKLKQQVLLQKGIIDIVLRQEYSLYMAKQNSLSKMREEEPIHQIENL